MTTTTTEISSRHNYYCENTKISFLSSPKGHTRQGGGGRGNEREGTDGWIGESNVSGIMRTFVCVCVFVVALLCFALPLSLRSLQLCATLTLSRLLPFAVAAAVVVSSSSLLLIPSFAQVVMLICTSLTKIHLLDSSAS